MKTDLDKLRADARRTRWVYGVAIISVTAVTTYLFLQMQTPRPTGARASSPAAAPVEAPYAPSVQ